MVKIPLYHLYKLIIDEAQALEARIKQPRYLSSNQNFKWDLKYLYRYYHSNDF